jgi:hypothetical protein
MSGPAGAGASAAATYPTVTKPKTKKMDTAAMMTLFIPRTSFIGIKTLGSFVLFFVVLAKEVTIVLKPLGVVKGIFGRVWTLDQRQNLKD